MEKRIRGKQNRTTLIVEIILTLAICAGIAFNSFVTISRQANDFAVDVMKDYNTLTNDYIRAFKVLRMEAVVKIDEGLSFDEMLSWLQSRDGAYRDAIGDNVFDGFAFTYKGGYVHSWDYGDYSDYDPNTRPWYQQARDADGEVTVVAPYVTFLSNTDLIEQYDILRMSIAQRYDDEISFDFDLDVKEINALLAGKATSYSGTNAFLYDKAGYILSSTNSEYYGHNINTTDSLVSADLSKTLSTIDYGHYQTTFRRVDGKLRMIYSYTDDSEKTLCMLVPFGEVFTRNFLYVFLMAVILIAIEITFYYQNKVHVKYLEKNRQELDQKNHELDQKNHELDQKNQELDQKNQELQNANTAKDLFLSRMSHELRTPLNAINGYAAVMERNLEENVQDDEKTGFYVKSILKAAKYQLLIIDDLLDIRKIQSGKVTLKPVEVNSSGFVKSIIEMVQPEADEKQIRITYTRTKEIYDTYWLDGSRLQQVLLNVLHNAIKFTPSGGKIEVTADVTEKSETENIIQFVISDNGIGMSEKFQQEQLFQPFMQEHGGTTSPHDGCGIGLYISRDIMRQMGGDITCESTQGKGSSFTITFTADKGRKRARRNRNRQRETYDLGGKRILLCEDNPMNQDIERRILEKMNCVVDIAEDGQIGVERFAKSEEGFYDIILMDIRMPNMDGLKATETIRGLDRGDAKTVPILAVSANSFPEDMQKSLNAGMNAHLAKPVNAKILYEEISKRSRNEVL